MADMVAVLILAAGRSSRMGRPKPLLPLGPTGSPTFIAHLIALARAAGLSSIYVVGRPEDVALRAEVHRQGATFIENPRSAEGQLSSVQVGLSKLESEEGGPPDAVMVMPADVPLIGASTVGRLVAASATSKASIFRATHEGRHGHPVLFKRAVFSELHTADPALGAKAVVRADPSRVENVEVDDPGVTVDVDTPDDYLRVFGRRP